MSKNKAPRFAVVAVDAVCFSILENKLHVLLGEVNIKPFYADRLGLIGGLVAPEQSAEEAVEQQLMKKVGITNLYKEQLHTFSKLTRDPRNRVISIAYLCLTADPFEMRGGSIQTIWCPIDEVPDLAYDHNEILSVAVERLRSRVGYTNVIQHFLPKEFTLTDLQGAYETVLNRSLDKRNFRKKVKDVQLVRATEKKIKRGASRPAELYRFASRGLTAIEIL